MRIKRSDKFSDSVFNPVDGGSKGSNAVTESAVHNNGFSVVAQALAKLGIKHMYGVVGIPVTELASAAQVRLVFMTSESTRKVL